MKYQFELSLIVRKLEPQRSPSGARWNFQSCDTVIDTTLTGLLGQFLIALALVHKRIVDDVKTELEIDNDDDIPF